MIEGSDAISGLFAGRYSVDREVGRGASAVVYRAVDGQSGQVVALKVLRDSVQQAVGERAFLREIRHVQRLHHPGIVPVLDSGNANGRLYYVLPFMDGGTLRGRLHRDRQMPLREAIAIAKSIAEALSHAHDAGLIHRDVKPENILFRDGTAHLSDFGIARALEHTTSDTTTSTGLVRGTPAYMSPEQAAGQAEYDGRSDLYALGCVLFEMIAGVPAFVGPTPQSIIAQRLSHRPVSVSQYRDRVPPALEALINKALMVTPADRFASGREFAAALERVVEDALVSSSGSQPVVSPTRSRQLYLAGAVVLAAVATGLLWPRGREPAPSAPDYDPRRIAVLFLQTLTPDVLPLHITDGITEDLIDRLSSVRGLSVISANGVRPFRDGSVGTDSIGRLLGVGIVVEGNAARSGNTLRVTVRLVDASDGLVVDSRTIEEPWNELFKLQDALTEHVQFWLRQRLGDEVSIRTHRASARSLEAWVAVQRASAEKRRAVEASANRGDETIAGTLFLRSDSLYVQAAQLDPRWAYPVVMRGSLALQALALWSPRPPPQRDSAEWQSLDQRERRNEWTRRAAELADAALRRDPMDAGARALRGEAMFKLAESGVEPMDSLIAAAEADLSAALAMRPDLAEAWSAMAELALHQGRFADAANASRQAYEADAFYESRRVLNVAFSAALLAEEFVAARQWCEIGLMHYRGDPRFTECALRLLGSSGRTLAAADSAWDLLRTIEQADTLKRLTATWGFRRLMVAAVLARAERHDSALALVKLVNDEEPPAARRSSVLAECYVFTLIGDRDRAFSCLEELQRLGSPQRTIPVSRHPWFRTLQGDPRFNAITAR